MVENIDPHIIGTTESWANKYISGAELGLTGYIMFRRDRIEKRGGGVILYIKESVQGYKIKLEREADCDEAVWCTIVLKNDSKGFYAYVRSKQNIRDKVGSLEDSAGNIISQGFLLAEENISVHYKLQMLNFRRLNRAI